MTAAFKDQIQKLLDIKYKAPNDHLALLMDCVRQFELSYKVPTCDPALFLAHKANRGGTVAIAAQRPPKRSED